MNPPKIQTHTQVFYSRHSYNEIIAQGNSAFIESVNQKDFANTEKLMRNVSNYQHSTHVFICQDKEHSWKIRWFNRTNEIRRCGHGTLAAAYILKKSFGYKYIIFQTFYNEVIPCKFDDIFTTIQIPSIEIMKQHSFNIPFIENNQIKNIYATSDEQGYLIIELNEAKDIINFKPNFKLISQYSHRGLILTAKTKAKEWINCTFRYFAPQYGINEDQATGSAAAILSQYYKSEYGMLELHLFQQSLKGGYMMTAYDKDHTSVSGLVTTNNHT